MKITHLNNSFFLIESNSTRLVCDPWIGPMEGTALWSYPIITGAEIILNKLQPNYIYISHLHTDHLDRAVLRCFSKKKLLS